MDWMRFWLQDYEDPDMAKVEQYKRWRELRKLHGRPAIVACFDIEPVGNRPLRAECRTDRTAEQSRAGRRGASQRRKYGRYRPLTKPGASPALRAPAHNAGVEGSSPSLSTIESMR